MSRARKPPTTPPTERVEAANLTAAGQPQPQAVPEQARSSRPPKGESYAAALDRLLHG